MIIRLLLLDVDGVLTDGKVYINDRGEAFKAFNIKDGLGIKLAQQAGIRVGFITSRSSPIVEQRAKELEVTLIYQGVKDKLTLIKQLSKEMSIPLHEMAYIGDDIVDKDAMLTVSFSACPADAIDEIKAIATYIAKKNGGNGCVREVIDLILQEQRKK